jgi:hypothetical protein
MKNLSILLFIVIALTACGIKNNKASKEGYLIEENFDDNKLQWVEENTIFHTVEVADGKYIIHAKDTSKRTSCSPFNSTYLFNLKDSFQIKTNIKLIEASPNYPSKFGIILVCATMDYLFYVGSNNKVKVLESEYGLPRDTVILEKDIDNLNLDNPIDIEVLIESYSASIKVDNKDFGSVPLKSKSIEGIRIFATSETKIEVDYFKVKNN